MAQMTERYCWLESLRLCPRNEQRTRQSLRAVREKNTQEQAALVVVGPEGGFSDDEAGLAEKHGFERVHLGPRILRAETAAIVGGPMYWSVRWSRALRSGLPASSFFSTY